MGVVLGQHRLFKFVNLILVRGKVFGYLHVPLDVIGALDRRPMGAQEWRLRDLGEVCKCYCLDNRL